MRDNRITFELFTDVVGVLHRHGFTRGDDVHAGRAAPRCSPATWPASTKAPRTTPTSTAPSAEPPSHHPNRPTRTTVTRSYSRRVTARPC